MLLHFQRMYSLVVISSEFSLNSFTEDSITGHIPNVSRNRNHMNSTLASQRRRVREFQMLGEALPSSVRSGPASFWAVRSSSEWKKNEVRSVGDFLVGQ